MNPRLNTLLRNNRAAILRLALLILIVIYFSARASGFLDTGNLFSLMQAFALLGLVAVGLAVTMIAGEFDLSVGSMVAVSGIIAIKTGGDGAGVGLAVAVLFGLGVGLVNGLLTVWLSVSSLVVTVGTQIMLTGLAYGLAGGQTVSYDNFEIASQVDQVIATVFSPRSLVAIGACVVVWLLLRFTRLGRDIIATGSSRDAASAAGARTRTAVVASFAISGTFAALAGGLLAFSLLSAAPTTGADLLLQAVSAAILGGVALSGGIGTVPGVAVGALTLTALNNGLSFVGASDAAISISNGLLLLAVVTISAGGPTRLLELVRRRRAVPG
ncbi:ABC transporter permease [Conexibacter sp. CPCC 206217]|uniref:ABC transporter permease n=1 Tax=Conexibacter sp. CPCC 206217 TaxID=3064574 RepID=UPI00271E548B|nr:ABC transporter permease [Conexibacter sp. CPCC 206217]MDO8211900.1 ABC transporter permease [Conexibacter sp. CPCC 206217]